jgi:competence protein ComEA
MKTVKPHYFNSYLFAPNFFLILIFSLFIVCCVTKDTKVFTLENSGNLSVENALNINTASSSELEKLPFIGTETARKIVEHREKHGKYRRAEHLLLIEGISDKKYRQIKNYVKVE